MCKYINESSAAENMCVRNLMVWRVFIKGFEDVGGREESSWKYV